MGKGKEYVVEGAMCMCKFGTTPGLLKIIDHKFAHINGKKLIATTMNLGNVFQPPGFTSCKINPMFPKPCVPAITMWDGAFDKLKINRIASPLTDKSKGTCATGGPSCIEIKMTGQIALPAAPQMKAATNVFQGDLDPTGESLALTDHQIDCFLQIKFS
jgi:hypothetical protein